MPDIRDWLFRLAGWRLPGAPALEPPPATIPELLPAARSEKLVGVLAAAVEAGDVAVDDDGRTTVADVHHAAMGEVLLLEDVLLEAVEVLDRTGIGHRVLKGSALAHLVHADPSHRSFGDVDLLVDGRHLPAAVEALVAAGGERLQPALSREYDERFTKSVTLRWRRDTELDLHRTLAPGPYGLMIRTTDLRGETRVLRLGGRALDTPSLELHLLHGALHVALGDVGARLGNLRDVALMATRPDLDVDHVLGLARRWGCEAPVARGIAEAAMPGIAPTPLLEWAMRYRIGPDDERLLAAYDTRDRRFRRQALASLRVLPRWSDRVAYAKALGLPRMRRYARRP